MNISSKTTKAELLAICTAQEAQLANQYLTGRQVANTAQLVVRELQALVVDVFRLGAFCRKGFDLLVDTYRKPVLR